MCVRQQLCEADNIFGECRIWTMQPFLAMFYNLHQQVWFVAEQPATWRLVRIQRPPCIVHITHASPILWQNLTLSFSTLQNKAYAKGSRPAESLSPLCLPYAEPRGALGRAKDLLLQWEEPQQLQACPKKMPVPLQVWIWVHLPHL